MFKSIRNNSSAEIVEKKSKFIANIYYVESVEEAEKIIKQTNKKYFDARHNCYAFSIYTENGIVSRFSDDGEPSGTAGGPMLNILTSQNLCNVLIIVTRYFGGILLGTGGLVKAYTKASINALSNNEIVEKDYGLEVIFFVNYADLDKVKYYLNNNNISILDILYNENVDIKVEIVKEKLEFILEQKDNLNFTILNHEILGTKFVAL